MTYATDKSMVAKMQSSGSNGRAKGPEEFVDVWARNLEDEFTRLRRLIRKYPYVAMVSAGVSFNWSTC